MASHPASLQVAAARHGNLNKFDVFVSYSHRNGNWVRGWLLPRLEAAGIKVCIDYRDFTIGLPSQVNMEQAVESSHATILVLTPAWVKSEWTQFEGLMVSLKHPLNADQRLLPILLRKCKIPTRLGVLTYADFTCPDGWADQLRRLIGTILAQRKRNRDLPMHCR